MSAVATRWAIVAATAACACAQPGALAIEPYLTDLGADTATVSWRRAAPGTSELRWGLTPRLELGALSTAVGEQHQLTLTALWPGTTYHYRVDNAAGGTFRTLARSGELRFAVIGHTHGTETFVHQPDTLLAAALQASRPDFVVHAGDATWLNRVDDYRRHYFTLLRSSLPSTPVYLAPGNHDAGWPYHQDLDLRTFKTLFDFGYDAAIAGNRKEAFYVRDFGSGAGSFRFVFFSYTSDLRPGSPQHGWLGRVLGASNHRFKVAVFGGAQGGYYDETALLDELVRLGTTFVLRGDGVRPAAVRSVYRGMPMYFTGTGSHLPHSHLELTYRGGCLQVEEHPVGGSPVLIDRIGCAAGVLPAPKGLVDEVAPAPQRRPFAFAIEPYVARSGTADAVIAWQRNDGTPSWLRWGETTALTGTPIRRSGGGAVHHATIRGLRPGTRYHYSVDGSPLESFWTDSGLAAGTTALIGSELHDGEPDAALVQQLLDLAPDAVIHASSAPWSGEVAEWRDRFFTPLREVVRRMPIYPAPPKLPRTVDYRDLFYLPYAGVGNELYYARVAHGVLWLHLSHMAPSGPGSAQRAFVQAQLQAAADVGFAVAVIGGRSSAPADDFLRFLAAQGVDAVVRCDLVQPADPRRTDHGLPEFIAGSGYPNAHRLLLFERCHEVLLVKLTVPGQPVRVLDWIYRRRNLQAVQTLDTNAVTWLIAGGALRGQLVLTPPVSTRTVGGLQMRFRVPSTRPHFAAEVYVLPTDRGDRTGLHRNSFGYGFRSQVLFIDGDDDWVTVPFLAAFPHDGQPFDIDTLTLRFLPDTGLAASMLTDLRLYAR